MFKAIGCAMLLAAFTGGGLYGEYRLKVRVRELERCILMIQMIEDELKYSLSSAEQILTGLAVNPLMTGFDLLRRYECLCAEGIPFYRAFERAAEQFRGAMTEQDRCILRELPMILGRSQAESQINALENSARRLELQRQKAAEAEQTHGRLYRSLGMLGGMAVCLMVV